MKSRPTLLLRDTARFVVMQHQGSVSLSMAHVTTIGHANVPGLGCIAWDHFDIEGLCRVGPTPTGCHSWESRPEISPGQHRAGPGIMSKGELSLLIICLEVAQA